ncbi:DUF6959 family protein [Actinoplanes sp. NPDC049681]|uniref:DUF6959 family protein n=1 Tax=Actinoplanes sp. NPDC049681 TaxID=3363905 RepID=UPI0037895827
MNLDQARVLAPGGNAAVTHLDGRAFPGIHIQGDTFAELQRQLADSVSRVRHAADDTDAWDDLDYVVEEVTQILRFYRAPPAASPGTGRAEPVLELAPTAGRAFVITIRGAFDAAPRPDMHSVVRMRG